MGIVGHMSDRRERGARLSHLRDDSGVDGPGRRGMERRWRPASRCGVVASCATRCPAARPAPLPAADSAGRGREPRVSFAWGRGRPSRVGITTLEDPNPTGSCTSTTAATTSRSPRCACLQTAATPCSTAESGDESSIDNGRQSIRSTWRTTTSGHRSEADSRRHPPAGDRQDAERGNPSPRASHSPGHQAWRPVRTIWPLP